MMRYNNYIYAESRRFDKVFPNYEIFKENTIPYILDNDLKDADNLLIIYNRLMLQYADSFYAYERNGTIYQKNVERVTKMLIILNQYNQLKELVKNKVSNSDINEFFDTDNEEDANVVGSLTSKTNHQSLSTDSYNKLIIKQTNLLAKIDQEIEKYQSLFLNNRYYKRGEIYEN